MDMQIDAKAFLSGTSTKRMTITFSASAVAAYKATVARHPPETGAILGGPSNDPLRVTEVLFIPAQRGPDGARNVSASHFEPDMDFVNHILVQQWQPLGLTIRGYIHSHPGLINTLSVGVPGSRVGDLDAIRADLEAARQVGIDWPIALMPIVNFDAQQNDMVTGWVVTLEDSKPIPADVIFEDAEGECKIPDISRPIFPSAVEQIVHRARAYQECINMVLGVETTPDEDRRFLAIQLRELMRADIADLVTTKKFQTSVHQALFAVLNTETVWGIVALITVASIATASHWLQ